jgi:hypothetical protein
MKMQNPEPENSALQPHNNNRFSKAHFIRLPCVSRPPAKPTRGGMKLCPIHRTSLFLSDGWESVELQADIVFC